MKRKTLVFLSCFALLLGSAFFFRYQFLVVGTKLFLHRTFADKLTYEKVSTDGKKLYIEGFHIHDERVDAKLDGVVFSFDFQKLLFRPVRLFQYYRSGFSNIMGLLTPFEEFGMQLSIENGMLTLDEERYYFHLKNGQGTNHIGTLNISHDPKRLQHPVLSIDFQTVPEGLSAQIDSKGISSKHLVHLASFALPDVLQGFTGESGHVNLSGTLIFNQGGEVDALSAKFDLNNFQIENQEKEFAFAIETLSGDINYPEGADVENLPMWKKLGCNFNLEEGCVIWRDKLGLKGLKGHLALDPREDPVIHIKGALLREENPLEMQLRGKGAMHDDHVFWLEFALNLNDHVGTECEAFISFSHPEEGAYALQLQASNLLAKQMEMVRSYFANSMPRLKQWEILEGNYGGKLVALFEEGKLSHFEMQNLVGEKIKVRSENQIIELKKMQGEGRLFDSLQFEAIVSNSQFFGFFDTQLKEVYEDYRPEDIAYISTNVKFSKKWVETSSSVQFKDESIQFGFKSSEAFPGKFSDVQEAWARSEKLTPSLYSPFVGLFARDLEIYGDIDLLATFDGKQIEMAFAANEFLSKHPLCDLKTQKVGEKDQTKGRAKLTLDPFTLSYHGEIPIQNGKGYDRHFGIYFQDLDGKIIFSNENMSADISHMNASFDGKPLLKNASCKVHLGNEKALSNLTGILPLKTDKEYHLYLPILNPTTCDFRITEGKKQIAKFSGKKDKNWEGLLSLDAIPHPLSIDFDWDYTQDQIHLHAKNEEMQLIAKKLGPEYILEQFQYNDIFLRALFTKAKEGFTLPHFSYRKEDVQIQGAGAFTVDLPGSTQSLAIRSDLVFEARGIFPTPLETITPVKAAFTPETGLILTDSSLVGEGVSFKIGQFEYLFSTKKTALNYCEFQLSDEVYSSYMKEDILPQCLQDLTFCKNLSGKGSAHFNNKGMKAKITMGDASIELKKRGAKYSANLMNSKSSDRLECVSQKTPSGFMIESMKGRYGPLHAELWHQGKENTLKGFVELDFTKFSELFDLPLNQTLNKWSIGGGYRFEGIFTEQKRIFDWNFKGRVKANAFECMGYQLRSMEAKVDIDQNHIAIENLDITDDAGKLWISEGALMGSHEGWRFSFPLVEIRSLHPSLLNKLSGPERPISPLIIKSMNIHDFRGFLGSTQTFTGNGSISFTNKSKKGQRHLPNNLPYAILKQMGLDGALFVPAIGELDYTMQNGRCYLRSIRNMKSDQNRSEFLPPKTGVMGYVDLSGNTFLDLQIKQKAVPSITAPISLKIRGKWEEPEFIIK